MSAPPPLLRRPAPAPYFHSLFLIFQILPLSPSSYLWEGGVRESELWIAFTFTKYHPPPFCWGKQFSVPNFKKGGSEKNPWGDLKSSCHEYLPEGDFLCFLSKNLF